MSNLRWILLFAGFAILLLLYFSGRPRKAKRATLTADDPAPRPADRAGSNDIEGARFDADALAQDLAPGADRTAGSQGSFRAQGQADPGFNTRGRDVLMDGHAADYPAHHAPEQPHYPPQGYTPGSRPDGRTMEVGQPYADGYAQASPQQMDPGYSPGYHQDPAVHGQATADPHSDQFSPGDVFGAVDPDDWQRPAGSAQDLRRTRSGDSEPFATSQGEDHVQSMGSSIGEKIEAFSARLTPRRKSRVAASTPSESRHESTDDTKIVSLHVVAPQGRIITGQLLLDTFEARGYHHGDMNIFHSLHNGNTVFSVAKMVVPGTFDINDPDSFETPGITLFLQLPGPVPGDVAFEVLISEAYELASALGCNILDSDRSTLSRQTVQHLREGVYEYMHRQKYFNKAASKVPG